MAEENYLIKTMKKWIVQKLTICYKCQKELPEGSNCYLDENNKIICLDCGNEEGEENDGILD